MTSESLSQHSLAQLQQVLFSKVSKNNQHTTVCFGQCTTEFKGSALMLGKSSELSVSSSISPITALKRIRKTESKIQVHVERLMEGE